MAINGKVYRGNYIYARGDGKVIVDGKEAEPYDETNHGSHTYQVTVTGNNLDVSTGSSPITVNGGAGEIKTGSGSVRVTGNSGAISTMSGTVTVSGSVTGPINTVTGSVIHGR